MVDSLALLRFGGTQPSPYCWPLHKNTKETIIFYFLLAPPNHSLGSFIMRGRLSGYGKVPRGKSHDHGATHSRSTLLTSAFPLLCFVHNSERENFQGTSQGLVATSGRIFDNNHLS
jgi:hypothetical protein